MYVPRRMFGAYLQPVLAAHHHVHQLMMVLRCSPGLR